eukprot:5071031-Prymnesium_polylepis.1
MPCAAAPTSTTSFADSSTGPPARAAAAASALSLRRSYASRLIEKKGTCRAARRARWRVRCGAGGGCARAGFPRGMGSVDGEIKSAGGARPAAAPARHRGRGRRRPRARPCPKLRASVSANVAPVCTCVRVSRANSAPVRGRRRVRLACLRLDHVERRADGARHDDAGRRREHDARAGRERRRVREERGLQGLVGAHPHGARRHHREGSGQHTLVQAAHA